MKQFINIITKHWIFGVLAVITMSCDLGLQEEWEYVPDPYESPQIETTVYQWMLEINADPTYNDSRDEPEFKYLLEAIAKTGMEDEFDDPNDQRTFFLLRNNAWKNNNQILKHLAGSTSATVDDISADRLEHLLKYHMIDTIVDQGPSLPKSDFHYYFRTLVGADGAGPYRVSGVQDTTVLEINRRIWNYQLRINTTVAGLRPNPTIQSNLPSTRKGGTVAQHNYRFTNGVGHQLNGYVRHVPF